MSTSKTRKNKKNEFKTFVPELKSNFISDTFVDYEGVERHFTIAAVSVPQNLAATTFVHYIDEDGDDILDDDTVDNVEFEKVLYIGVAVQRSEDTFNEELGKRIAYGKALKNKNRFIYVSHKGLVNTPMVEALLQQEAEYFKKDPGFYIAGYDKHKKEYETNYSHLGNNNPIGYVDADFLSNNQK